MSNQLHNDGHLKDLFGGFETKPSSHSWDRISNSLDRLRNTPFLRKYSKWMITASFLLGAISVIALNFVFPDFLSILSGNKSNDQLVVSSQESSNGNSNSATLTVIEKDAPILFEEQSVNELFPSNSSINDVGLNRVPSNNVTFLSSHPTALFPVSKAISFIIPMIEQEYTALARYMAFVNPIKLQFVDFINESMIPPVVFQTQTEVYAGTDHIGGNRKKNRSSKTKGLYLGSSFSLNNIWIINQNTYNDFEGYELDYYIDYGTSYGLIGGFDFADSWGVQVEWHINSIQGQKYEDLISRENVKREVNLNYTKIPVLLQYKLGNRSGLGLAPVSLNMGLGGYVSFLKVANINNNGDEFGAYERFNNVDYGLVLQIEYDKFISKRLSLSLGAVGNLGIRDINSEEWQIRDSFGTSVNALVGVNAGIKYHIYK